MAAASSTIVCLARRRITVPMITGGVTTQNAAISEPVTSERMPTTSGARAVPNTVEHRAKAETLTPRACTGVTTISDARSPGTRLAAAERNRAGEGKGGG